jgi:hypothetical protein
VHTYNPRTEEAEEEKHEFKASLGCLVSPWPYLKRTSPPRNKRLMLLQFIIHLP